MVALRVAIQRLHDNIQTTQLARALPPYLPHCPQTYLPSSSVQTTLDPAHATEMAETDSPPEAPKAERLLGGCPQASATGVRRVADSMSTRRVVKTASIGTAAWGALPLEGEGALASWAARCCWVGACVGRAWGRAGGRAEL